jgi:hypothetical protein
MFEIGGLPEITARLWEAASFAAGDGGAVTITASARELTISRMAVLEAIFADDPPTREDIRAWVVATAQRLGFRVSALTRDEAERMEIERSVDGLTVRVQGFWCVAPEKEEAAERERPRLVLVTA